MNYYIQGSAARAEQIKAAFEKLGYRSAYVFNAEMTLYFTFNGEIKTAVANSYKSIIKTHPDYKELELPVEESPYIHVVFCKGYNGWVPFTGYGCDISPKKTVEFINCINDAADVLNGKEE